MSETETQLDGFIDKFDQANQLLIRNLRAKLQARFPTAHELAYDNYNFFVIGYCANERPSSAIVSLVADAKGASLSFYHGADLEDPEGLLLGQGRQNRFIRLPSVEVLDQPGIATLMDQAVQRSEFPLPETGEPTLVIRSVSAKQRPRRRD